MLVGILLSFGSSLFCNSENSSSMDALLTTCIVLKFSNSNMAVNILVEKPSYNGVEAFIIVVSSNILECVRFFKITFSFPG